MIAHTPCFKALSHGAIFLATCNAILLLGDVKLANTSFHHSLLIFNIPNICHKFTSLKSKIALQVASCDRAFNITIFPSVSCLCWNDGILVTASWDSTVKVSLLKS